MSNSSQRTSLPLCLIFSFGGLALACASRDVDLGGGTLTRELVRDTRCSESTRIDGDVRVTSQAELSALEGCEEIRGELAVQLFANADLTPLHALRSVDGTLVLGASELDFRNPDDTFDQELLEATAEVETPLLEGGWLSSLSGLSSLERIGALVLRGSSVSDLTGFEHLESFGGSAAPSGVYRQPPGSLFLSQNPELRHLTGLENARGAKAIGIGGNPLLESLHGLQLGTELAELSLYDSPRLSDLGALSSVTSVSSLSLDATGVTDLSALSALATVGTTLFITNNPALEDASGLGHVQQVQSILFLGNPALTVLTAFSGLYRQPDVIVIEQNDGLEQVKIDLTSAVPNSFGVGESYRDLSVDLVNIGNNAALREISIVPGLSEVVSPGLNAAQIVWLHENASLNRIDFGSLRRADLLAIDQNPSLSQIDLGALATVDSLELTDNPQLSSALFADVKTFERTLSGNADDAP